MQESPKPKLRLGLLLDSFTIHTWRRGRLRDIRGTICYRILCIAIGLSVFLHAYGRTEVRPVLTVSPVHIHQTAEATLSGWLGAGIGAEINRKWAVNVAWEFSHSVFLTMEPPMYDTVQWLHILGLEVVRIVRVREQGITDLRIGLTTGLGVKNTTTYAYADSAVTYDERALSQRFVGSERKNQPFVGMVVGCSFRFQGLWLGVDYRPKLYGLGDENTIVHSGGLILKFPLGSR